MRNSSTLFFLIAAAAAYGADGIVVDPSGRPVPGARVACANLTTQTGADGRFTLASTRSCRASIAAEGFETLEVELAPDAPVRVELGIARLAERVVVSATRRETTPEQAGVAATVLTQADLAARVYPALGEVLPEVPGVQVARYGRPGSLTQVFGRGGERTGMLVMIDGVPVNDPGGEVNLAGLTTSNLERIEVVRGPESALFGAEASAGVIQLFTKRGDPEARVPHGSVAYDRGSFQTDRWIANLAGGLGDRFDYSLGAEQFHTVGEYRNDFFRDTTGTANVGFRIAPATQVRGIFRKFDAVTGTPNQVGYGIFDNFGSEETRDTLAAVSLDDARGQSFTQRVRFGYHRSWDTFYAPVNQGPYDTSALVRDVAGPAPRTYFEGLARPGAPVPAGLRVVTADPYSAFIYAADPYLTLSSRKDFEYQGALAHPGGALVFGYAYERQDAEIGGLPVSRDNHGVFLHEQYTVARRLFLSGGARLEQNSAFHTKLTPRGAASYLVAGEHGVLSSTFVRASAGIGITEPSLLQNYSNMYYAIGNRALRPEKTVSYEAGIVQEWFRRRVRTEVSAFHNFLRDLIVFVYPTWENINASRARGVEFSAQGRINRVLSVQGSYTHLWTRIVSSLTPDSMFTGVGQELPKRAGNSGSASFTLAPRRWTLQAGAVLVGERQDPDQYIFGISRNRGYQTVYASGSFRLTKHVVPYIRVANLLDQDYMEVLGFPAASRNVHGGLRLEW
ncbi:MAG: TonB-dependent receptor [Acidobacteriota bacterium]